MVVGLSGAVRSVPGGKRGPEHRDGRVGLMGSRRRKRRGLGPSAPPTHKTIAIPYRWRKNERGAPHVRPQSRRKRALSYEGVGQPFGQPFPSKRVDFLLSKPALGQPTGPHSHLHMRPVSRLPVRRKPNPPPDRTRPAGRRPADSPHNRATRELLAVRSALAGASRQGAPPSTVRPRTVLRRGSPAPKSGVELLDCCLRNREGRMRLPLPVSRFSGPIRRSRLHP